MWPLSMTNLVELQQFWDFKKNLKKNLFLGFFVAIFGTFLILFYHFGKFSC